MKEKLNKVNNPILIKILDNCDITFLEENVKLDSPVESYYFKWSDLSINLSLRLKWALHGFFFFKSIMEALDDENYTNDIIFENNINLNLMLREKKLIIDGIDMSDIKTFLKELEEEYSKLPYSENSLIHFKLKLSVKEYIILKDVLIPKLIFYEK